jgi:hypothetical protein
VFRSPPLHDAVCRRSEKLYSLLDHGIGQPEEREAAYLKAKCLSPEVIDVLARPAQPLKYRRLDQSDDKTFT